MLNHVKMVSLLNVEVLFCVFWEPFWPHAPKRLPLRSLSGALWESSGHLWETFGDQGAQRLPKVFQKRSNGSKAFQKGSKKTKWFTFLEKFDVFSTIFVFSFVLASIWLLLAPFGFDWLLLPPIVSYCLFAAPLVSYRLLLAAYWLLLHPIASYCLFAAPLYNVTACATFGSVSWDTTGVVGFNRYSLACYYRRCWSQPPQSRSYLLP